LRGIKCHVPVQDGGRLKYKANDRLLCVYGKKLQQSLKVPLDDIKVLITTHYSEYKYIS